MNFKFLVLAFTMLGLCTIASATDNPGPSDPVEYDGSAIPSPVTGAIGFTSPNDGYDWYCASVTAGQQVDVTLTRDSGDILLNGGAYPEILPAGSTVADFTTATVADTGNSTQPDVSYSFVPAANGVVTFWVATWTGEAGGDYTMTVTGAGAATCGLPAAPSFAVPSMSAWSLTLLALVLGMAGFFGIRRFV